MGSAKFLLILTTEFKKNTRETSGEGILLESVVIFADLQFFCVYGNSLEVDISGCEWAINIVDGVFTNLGNDLSKHDVDGSRSSYYIE